MIIYCCHCVADVDARLTSGAEVYAHRTDLHELPFWICDNCKNFVGCHHKTATPTKPLGVIATQDIKDARKHIHALIDPVWKSGSMKRGKLYGKISKAIGYQFHTAEIRSLEQARNIYKIAKSLVS